MTDAGSGSSGHQVPLPADLAEGRRAEQEHLVGTREGSREGLRPVKICLRELDIGAEDEFRDPHVPSDDAQALATLQEPPDELASDGPGRTGDGDHRWSSPGRPTG